MVEVRKEKEWQNVLRMEGRSRGWKCYIAFLVIYWESRKPLVHGLDRLFRW